MLKKTRPKNQFQNHKNSDNLLKDDNMILGTGITDRKLYNDLNMQIETPDELDLIIKNGLNKSKKNHLIIKKIRI